MVTTTTTYSFKKPTVGDDEDLWGGYLNDSMDLIDDVLDGTTPVTGIDINSGTIDNAVIGGTTPVAGTFTTLNANTSLGVTGNITVSGTVDGVDIATRDGVLTTTTTTANAALPKAGGTMTGTLTGTSAVFSGDLTVDTNTLYVDSTNNRVGVGTSSPYTLLELSSTDPILRFNDSNGGTDTKNFELRHVGTNSPDIDGLYFRTVNDANTVYSDKMVILGSGNVGIGTTSPSAKVHSVDSNGNVLRLQRDGAFTGSWDVDIGSYSTGDFTIYDNENSQRAITVEKLTGFSGTSAMYIDSSGNVGIGTTSPSSLIHASGAAASGGSVEIRLEDTAASSHSRLMRTGSAYSYAGVGANETWLYHSGAGTINIGPDGAGTVKIVTNGSERMRVESGGTVVTTGSLVVGDGLDINNGNGTQTHWNYANGSANYIRGTNTTFDTPIDMNNNTITDAGDIYTNDWFRNNNAGEGLYNEATGAHIASDATDQWTFRDAGTSMRLLLKTENANHRGSVYATNSNEIGFLDSDSHWAIKHVRDSRTEFYINNTEYMQLDSNGLYLYDGSLREDYDALSGTSPTCNINNGGAFSLTMTGNTTFTFSGGLSGMSNGFVLQLTGNGSTVTWPASVDWAGGTAPDAPASGETDILVFWTRDGGTTWYGVQSIDAAS